MSTKVFLQKKGAVGFWQPRGGLAETRERSTLQGCISWIGLRIHLWEIQVLCHFFGGDVAI